MANQEHLDQLKQGVPAWNAWRVQHLELIADLGGIATELQGADLSGANFMNTKLDRTNLWGCDMSKANLSYTSFVRTTLPDANLDESDLTKATMVGAFLERATLKGAILREANLEKADLSDADLSGANLWGANLLEANLSGARLCGANLEGTILAKALLDRTDLTGANLTDCSVYGVSPWNVQLTNATQRNLVITLSNEPVITVDDLEMAQFIYLLLTNQKIRNVIDTIASKVVLILGRFTPERKTILDALKDRLRRQNYTPVLFDFEKPDSRDLTETVSILAHLARFIIVDLTDPSSAPHEVATIIPQTVVPVQPLLLERQTMVDGTVVSREYALFENLRRRHHWVLPTFRYQNITDLLDSLESQIIVPAERMARDLMQST